MIREMEAVDGYGSTVDETLVFLYHTEDPRNPRQHGWVICRLDGILLLILTAMLAGADGFADIAVSGR